MNQAIEFDSTNFVRATAGFGFGRTPFPKPLGLRVSVGS